MSKDKDADKIIIRHILEVRLKKKIFSFIDIKGKMIDFVNSKHKFTQLKLKPDGTRFDLADDEVNTLYFFGLENFGFQIEAKEDFETFKSEIKKLIEVLKEYPEYNVSNGFIRIGVRSIILYHRKFDNIVTLKKAYKEKILKDIDSLTNSTSGEIVDTSHTFDMLLEKSKVNVLTGPVTRDEAMQKFFENKAVYSQKFSKENGLLLAIDASSKNPDAVKTLDDLNKRLDEQVDEIVSVFNGFKEHFKTSI